MTSRFLKPGGRIDRYVARIFVASFATAVLVLVGLFLILDMASNLDEYVKPWRDGTTAPAVLIVRYYLLEIPFVFLQVGPFVSLVAALFTAARLVRHSELTAMLSAGVGSQRLLAPVFLGAALCGAGMFVLREALGGQLGRQRDAVKFVLDRQSYDEVYTDLWLRDVDGSIVHLLEFRPGNGRTRPAEVRGLELLQRVESRWVSIEAVRAVHTEAGGRSVWSLEQGVRREVDGLKGEHAIDRLDDARFTPELALAAARARENPTELSYRQARALSRRDPDDVVYRMLLQYDVTFPVANLVLLLVGLPLALRHTRRKGAEGSVIGGILCLFYFATDFVMKSLGLQGSLDPYLATWVPIVAFGSLGVVLFATMDT